MPFRSALPSLALVLLLLNGRAPGGDAKVMPPPSPVELRFHDGSVLQNVVLDGAIELQTKYGKLVFPIDEVRRVEFGVRVPEELAKKLEKALEILSSDMIQQREAAGRELVALGRYAYPALQEASRNAGPEMKKRLGALMKEIRAKVPAYQLRLKEEDVVFTADSMFAGRIIGRLTGKNKYFGEVHLPLGQLRDMRVAGSEVQVVVDGAKNRLSDGWLETDFVARGDQNLTITASGELDFGQFVCGPEGNPQQNMTQPEYSQLPWGALLGKIGEDGEIFVVGKAYSGRAPRDGRVYLAVGAVMSRGTGAYDVKITLGEP